MAKYEVERVQTRGGSPGDALSAQITGGGVQGKTLLQVIPLFDEILLVWQAPAKESRGSTGNSVTTQRPTG